MPRLWNRTIETHRLEVRTAILETTAALVAEHGLRSVSMSQIAEQAGIGRATLYKYFPDVESILVAWHDRHVAAHLEHLAAVRDKAEDPEGRLTAVLEAYALITHGLAHQRYGTEAVALVHSDEHAGHAQRRLHELIRDVLAEAAASGAVRADVAPDELAGYCRHALAASRDLPSKAAVRRLVTLVLAGLRPPGPP
ncbi:MAG: TetR family transcriptional regulator [Streptosporangiales bacterium]|nr:TetR family transcriptional regulator [Streptosporangiales bacterium]